MKKYLLLCFFVVLSIKAYTQTCASPLIVDFSKKADTSTVYNGSPNGNLFGDNNCIVFAVKVSPQTDLINFNVDQLTGASFYTINCGPLIPIGTPACIAG